jgi:mono/diheme cytochrome c family protein
MRARFGFGAVVLTGGLCAWAALSASEPRATSAGVYTASQASAGETLYYARCSTCHGDDLGGVERAPALAGASFVDSWNGKNLRRLFDRVASMPPAEPVTARDAADVLAFLLRESNMPTGTTALPDDRAQLADIVFERGQP